MIQSLKIGKLGKFTNKVFNFQQTTVFVGNNESGKTTILDALAWALGIQKLPGTEVGKKIITDRYGKIEELEVSVETSDVRFTNESIKSFLSSATFSEGELSGIDSGKFMKDTNWGNYVKESLLDQSINLKSVISDLGKILSTSLATKEAKNRKALNDNLQTTKEELTKLQKEYETSLSTLGLKKENQSMLEDLQSKLAGLDNELASAKEQLESLNGQKKRLALTKELQIEVEWKAKAETLEELSLYSKDESKDWNTLKSKEQESKTLIEQLKKEIQELNSKIQSKQNWIASASAEDTTLRKSSFAEKWLALWDDAYRNNQFHTERRIESSKPIYKKLSYGFFLLGLAALGFSGLLFSQNSNSILLLVSLGFGAFVVFLGIYFFLKKDIQISLELSSEKENEFLNQIKSDYYLTFSNTEIQSFQSNRDLKSFLQKLIEGKNQSTVLITESKKELASLETALSGKKKELENLENNLRNIGLDLSHWLATKKVGDWEEYKTKRALFESTKSQIDQILSSLGYSNEQEKAKKHFIALKEQLNSLPEATESLESIQINIAKLEKAQRDLSTERENSLIKIANLREAIANADGRLINRDQLENKLQSQLNELKRLQDDKVMQDRNLKATEIAKNILEEMNQDSSLQYNQIVQELKKEWSFFFGDKEIILNEFSERVIQLEDLEGEERKLEHLSHGTKGLFYFIFKVLLHLKHESAFKCLFLDDALHFFDKERMEKILLYLKDKQTTNGLQLVFLTKPNMCLELIKKTFPDALEHSLS